MGREMEGVSRGRGHMYTYGWFMWMYGRNQPDNKAIIFQLKNKLIEKKKIWDPCLVVWSSRTSFNSLNWFVELMSLKKKDSFGCCTREMESHEPFLAEAGPCKGVISGLPSESGHGWAPGLWSLRPHVGCPSGCLAEYACSQVLEPFSDIVTSCLFLELI